jgi:hypothetical protein
MIQHTVMTLHATSLHATSPHATTLHATFLHARSITLCMAAATFVAAASLFLSPHRVSAGREWHVQNGEYSVSKDQTHDRDMATGHRAFCVAFRSAGRHQRRRFLTILRCRRVPTRHISFSAGHPLRVQTMPGRCPAAAAGLLRRISTATGKSISPLRYRTVLPRRIPRNIAAGYVSFIRKMVPSRSHGRRINEWSGTNWNFSERIYPRIVAVCGCWTTTVTDGRTCWPQCERPIARDY